MNELLEQFIAESREVLQAIGEKLMALEREPFHEQSMVDLFRLVHTLKGNSGLFDFEEMKRVLHAGEDVMDAVRAGRVQYSSQVADGLLEAMDFVGELCDTIEARLPTPEGAVQKSVQLAGALRALMVEAKNVQDPECIDGERAPQKSESVREERVVEGRSSTEQRWAHIPVSIREHAGEMLKNKVPLWGLEYHPSSDCFFQGADPLHQSRSTPGLVWGGVIAPPSWPDLKEMDAYECVLAFEMIVKASRQEIEEHYRYVPDQIKVWALEVKEFEEPSEVSRTESVGSWSHKNDSIQEVITAQRSVLMLPDEAHGFVGRIHAVKASLWGCVMAWGRGDDLGDLEKATRETLARQSSQALLEWLNHWDTSKHGDGEPLAEEKSEPGLMQAYTQEGHEDSESRGAALPIDPREVRRSEAAMRSKSLKVDSVKIDQLMNLIGEMVVAKNAIPFLARRAESVYGARDLSREIKAQYAVINRISEAMHHAIMQVRMMPVSFVMQRFPRLVRDVSRALGKEVNLVMEGQETAADKNIVEALSDPLIHIVRNCLDHGIELPQVRKAMGKAPTGTLKISAKQEADRVMIEISDDGKGMDPQVIKRKAYEKGLIHEEDLDRMSDQEAIHWVFAAGFSTAENISELSGRGVGMDVVRSAVERMNGSVHLKSIKGEGTTLTLSLPLSMAMAQVMTVSSNGQMFGVPMEWVAETVRVAPASVHRIKNKEVMMLRGQLIPLVGLHSLLGLSHGPIPNDSGAWAVLVVHWAGETVGIVVDNFHGTAEIILKPLTGILASLKAYMGSALMGDGSVLMVLDIKEVIQ